MESFDLVPLLAAALGEAGIRAPVTDGLSQLIAGELPLEKWVELVRTTVPVPARRRVPRPPAGFWARWMERWRDRRRRRMETVL